ncbi:Phage holin family Hol44, holin superfamily V [Gracilibacillus orientalis]|uniref:Phage holin family Hol44, holin superfamily V n=1 Tax=Gracilibacillus orientalis TaxID=334253 RepID=A0A1I4QUE6_9BACI|nr:phage holin family protein [Gracilibacillus orientalis]SFM43326.1 Phage holin family Hol44, holin superfamily V [Gracilibacillus orientalis]
MEEFLYLLPEDFHFIIPALWFIGYACKRTPFIPDWLIIWILLSIGVLAACNLYGWNIRSIAEGIIATGLAVFSHQIVKQTSNRVEEV